MALLPILVLLLIELVSTFVHYILLTSIGVCFCAGKVIKRKWKRKRKKEKRKSDISIDIAQSFSEWFYEMEWMNAWALRELLLSELKIGIIFVKTRNRSKYNVCHLFDFILLFSNFFFVCLILIWCAENTFTRLTAPIPIKCYHHHYDVSWFSKSMFCWFYCKRFRVFKHTCVNQFELSRELLLK